MERPVQAGETCEANNQIDLLIRHSEYLIIEKIREFKISFYNINIINVIKKINAIFIKFKQYTHL